MAAGYKVDSTFKRAAKNVGDVVPDSIADAVDSAAARLRAEAYKGKNGGGRSAAGYHRVAAKGGATLYNPVQYAGYVREWDGMPPMFVFSTIILRQEMEEAMQRALGELGVATVAEVLETLEGLDG